MLVAAVSGYPTGDAEEKKCAHAVCICDMEMFRCMKHYKNELNVGRTSYHRCTGTIFVLG